MSIFSYPHFCVEHVHGHHRWVATSQDPATARRGENLYAFLLRCIPNGWLSAWRWETHRLHSLNKPPWHVGNRLLRYALQVLALYLGVFLVFGVRGLFVFAAQGLVSVFLLEAINYVQHYGLLRKELVPGQFETVQPWHAWNFSHRLSNALVFNLGRHSDHHCGAQRPFHELEHRHDGPQLPAGYAAMVVLALFPPLWHWVMDARVQRWREEHGYEA
jgi:alkane 1-monooxygenase